MQNGRWFFLAIGALLTTFNGCAQTTVADTPEPHVTLVESGSVDLDAPHIGQLSGLMFGGGDRFIVVSDKRGTYAPAQIKIDLETGAILEASVSTQLDTLEGRRDVEAVSMDTDCMLVVADEAGTITRHHPISGKLIDAYAVPPVFKHTRPNRGFESLSVVDPRLGSDGIWAANEEALKVDGPAASDSAGTLIRLQRFDREGQPDAQFAYLADPSHGARNLLGKSQSGVSGIISLGRHRLIVLERSLGGDLLPSFRMRLYLVDTRGAADTSSIDSLANTPIDPVKKMLLLELNTGRANFEGITLGPQLNNGDYTLLLVSDDGGGGGQNPQRLLSLRVPAALIEKPDSKPQTDED